MKIITIGRTEIPKRSGLVSPSSVNVYRDRTGVVKIQREGGGGGERRGDEFRQQIGGFLRRPMWKCFLLSQPRLLFPFPLRVEGKKDKDGNAGPSTG